MDSALRNTNGTKRIFTYECVSRPIGCASEFVNDGRISHAQEKLSVDLRHEVVRSSCDFLNYKIKMFM